MKSAPILLAATILVAASGCGVASPVEESPEPIPMAFEDALNQAIDYGASDRQIEVLEVAVETGVLTYDQISALMPDLYTCFDDLGIPYVEYPPYEKYPQSGFLVPNYLVGDDGSRTASEWQAAVTGCQMTTVEYAYRLYQTQPLAVEARDLGLTQELPEVLACLSENGIDLPPEATLDEIRGAALDLLVETSEDDLPGEVQCTDNL
jgi:hypothetical protein